MSGIFGIFNRNGKPVSSEIIQKMLDAISYWGPDDSGTWINGSVALGHAMLWNTPESKLEHLPNTHDYLSITMDARLDNREELAKNLDLPNRPFEKITDSDFILAAYHKWGEDCPKYLLGDFAFAIWDKIKQQLFCARDHIGVKPFYYYLSKELFVFTNFLNTVTAHPNVTRKFNDTSLAKFLCPQGFYDNRSTFFKYVKKIPAASALVITSENVLESNYWLIEDITPLHYDSFEQYIEQYRILFNKSINSRLRTLYPVVSHLSGGLDSSSIAVLAARKLKKQSSLLYAFNWAQKKNDGTDSDHPEWTFSERIAKTEGIQFHRIDLLPCYMSETYNKVNIFNNDMGFFWEEYLVRDRAASCNVRTILSGWGGDQFISNDGYAYYSGLFWKGSFLSATQRIYQEYQDKSYRFLRTIYRSIKESIYPVFYKFMNGYYKKSNIDYDPYAHCQDQFAKYAKKVINEESKFFHGVHAEQIYLLREGLIQQRIESWAATGYDKGIEYSYPLLDKRIVEFSLALPEEFYGKKNGYNRFFFREAISNIIEDDIVWAPKNADLTSSTKRLELYDESLKCWLQSYSQDYKNMKSDYINIEKIISRLKNYFGQTSEKRGHLSSVIESIILFNRTSK